MRELIYISLWSGLFLGSVWAFDPGPYIVVSAAAGTFTAFAAFQQMNRRPKSVAVGWLGGSFMP